MTSSNDLSQAAHDRLSEELRDLSTRGRIDIAAKIEEARLQGDLSENGDYDAAKEEQGKMEARIRQIEGTLDGAQIVASSGGDSVSTGNRVEIRYEGDDDTEVLLYGSIEERHEDMTVVSPGSPLGLALGGAEIGETVTYESPSGPLCVEVVAITV